MRNFSRAMPVLLMIGFGVMAFGEARAAAAAPPVNACGCYRDSAGGCFCGRKGKCDCPGECEPKGCEEKRSKEIDKEIEAQTRQAREAEKKQEDEAAAKAAKEQQAENPSPGDDDGEAAQSEGEPAKDQASGAAAAAGTKMTPAAATERQPRSGKAKRDDGHIEAHKGKTKRRTKSKPAAPAVTTSPE